MGLTNARRARDGRPLIRSEYDALDAGTRVALPAPAQAWDERRPPLLPPRAALEILGGEVFVDAADGRVYYRSAASETIEDICDAFDVDELDADCGRLPHIARGARLTRRTALLPRTLVCLPEAALRSPRGISQSRRRKPCAACRLEGYVGALHCRETRRHDAPDFDAGRPSRVRTRWRVDAGDGVGPLYGWYYGAVVARTAGSVEVRYDDDPDVTFHEPWPSEDVVALPTDGSLPREAPDEADFRRRFLGTRLKVDGDDDDWATVVRVYVSFVEGFEGVVVGVSRGDGGGGDDDDVLDHLLSDLEVSAVFEENKKDA